MSLFVQAEYVANQPLKPKRIVAVFTERVRNTLARISFLSL